MSSHFDDIIEFHQHFGLTDNFKNYPSMTTPEIMAFRLKFLQEELTELANSCGFQVIGHGIDKVDFYNDPTSYTNIHDALDAFVDLWYVMVGTMMYMGIREPLFNEAWKRVHAANMTKVRVASSGESKRGSKFDVKKPKGWVAPTFHDLLANHSNFTNTD